MTRYGGDGGLAEDSPFLTVLICSLRMKFSCIRFGPDQKFSLRILWAFFKPLSYIMSFTHDLCNTFMNCWCSKGLEKWVSPFFSQKLTIFRKFARYVLKYRFFGKARYVSQNSRIRIRTKMSGIRNPALNIPCWPHVLQGGRWIRLHGERWGSRHTPVREEPLPPRHGNPVCALERGTLVKERRKPCKSTWQGSRYTGILLPAGVE